jgi:ribosome-associated heat shock protein Hsp15
MTLHDDTRMRLDKWLWAARFYKTRSIAAEEISRGRVSVNGQPVKAARDLRVGDQITLRQGGIDRIVRVRALSALRGPATVAQALYEETAESIAARQRQRAAEARRMGVEPALAQAEGRPTKRDRRRLADWRRWSASIDDLPDS